MFEIGNKVKNKNTGEFGHVIPDTFHCCSSKEVLVAYDSDCLFGLGTDRDILEDLGKDKQTPDPKKCGAGNGEHCCIFLACGVNGFECLRFTSMSIGLRFKDTMTAKREPKEPYPLCMIF